MTNSSPSKCSRCGTTFSSDTTDGLCPKCLMAMNLDSRTMPEEEKPPAIEPPSPEELAAKLPQFEIIELLGRGGMGIVYKARQKALDRTVAIKILAGEWQHDPGFSERFEKEAKLLAKLNHPNIVTVHDFGNADGLYYIVMEFVDGINLRDLLRDGHMESKQALGIIPPVCEALQFAHDKGIVHRDIKPENLLLDRDGRVKIADFGIAAMVGATGETSGTPPYMAPEQGGADVDHRVDIYALGAVLYETLTGERPDGPLQPPSQKVQIDVRIDDIVLRALNEQPERRYTTADQFRTMVETVASTNPTAPATAAAAAPTLASPTTTPSSGLDPRWSRAAGIILIVVGALGLLSAVFSSILIPIFGLIAPAAAPQGPIFDNPVGPEPPMSPGWFSNVGPVIATGVVGVSIVFKIALSILAILAGKNILRGTNRTLTIVGSVASMLITTFWPLGLLAGIFALVTILMDKSDGTSPSTSNATAKPAKTGPRLSGMAVTAAILQTLALGSIFLVMAAASLMVVRVSGGPSGPPQPTGVAFGPIIFLVVVPSLLMIPGTILGFISAAAIRNSNGQLRGMGAAKYALMVPVILISLVILIFAIRAALIIPLALDPNSPRITLLVIAILTIITFLSLLTIVLGKISRVISGDPATPREKRRLAFPILLTLLWIGAGLLVYTQMPHDVDAPITAKSPDNRYIATATTQHSMRIFGPDLLSYEFNVSGSGGRVDETWNIPVPKHHLAEGIETPPNSDFYFNKEGRIQWENDSKDVTFHVKDIPVFKAGENQGGYFRQKSFARYSVPRPTDPVAPSPTPENSEPEPGSGAF